MNFAAQVYSPILIRRRLDYFTCYCICKLVGGGCIFLKYLQQNSEVENAHFKYHSHISCYFFHAYPITRTS